MEILNLEGHLNCITRSRVTAILLNEMILPIVGASAMEGLLSTGPSPSSLVREQGMRDKGLMRKRPVQQKTKECSPDY